MGKAIEKIALENNHVISKVIDESTPIDELKNAPVDVAIEFTQPGSAFNNLKFCLESNIPVISGTTGWLDQLKDIEHICDTNNGTFLYASNFSIGVNLFFELNKWLAAKMKGLNFDTELLEIHHTEKKDSPSGTAITLAEGIIENQEEKEGWINEKSADHKKIGIVSERKPNVPGTHTVSYSSKLESIEITHIAHDRSVFAQGVVKVAEWIQKRKGYFTMYDFINSN